MTASPPVALSLPKDRQLILFRMVQEVFQNAMKHAAATHIHIKAEQQEAKLIVTIEDNGKGFDVNNTSQHGFGMLNLKHRVSLIGGVALWASDSKGTKVMIEIPHPHVH